MKTIRKHNERGDALFTSMFLGIGVTLLAVVALVGFNVVSALHVEEHTCTVIEKDRAKSNGGSDARLYTEDCGVLSVADSLFAGHWSSADTYASIKEGQTYDVTTRGFRVPFLSMFPNVVEATEVAR